MDIVLYLLILCGVFFKEAVCLKQNVDCHKMQDQLDTFTEKFAEMENQVERLQETLSNQQAHFEKTEENLRVQIEDLNKKLEAEKAWRTLVEQTMEGLLNKDAGYTHKRQTEGENPVAFYTGLSKTSTYQYGDNILFTNVTLNLGYHYMPSFGIFRAPIDGIYVFSVSLMVDSDMNTHAAIYVNDKPMTWMKLYGIEHEFDTTSQTAVYQLNQGDAVAVKHTESNKTFHGQYTYFSGFLLREIISSNMIIG